MANNAERIEEIRELLQSGVKSSMVDGTATTFDLESLRRELQQLMAEDETYKGRRPRVSRINLGASY